MIILLASAFTYRGKLFADAAEKLGIPVVWGIDVPPPWVGRANTTLALDYRDVPRSARRIEQFAKDNPVTALIGLDDSGTLIASETSKRLGLPYNDPDAALAARDKHIMRQKFAAAGVPSPSFQIVRLTDNYTAIAQKTQYPCVIKPTNLSGSRGVIRADNPEAFMKSVAQLMPILQEGRCDEFLVEDFIPGAEVALEGILTDGKLHVLALFDKPDPLDGPFFEETIYVTPSRLPEAVQQTISEVAQAAASSLGLRHGPVHAELRVHEGKAVMVEIAARSIGGNCSKTLRFGTDLSLEGLIIQHARFGEAALERASGAVEQREAGGVMMIPIPESGMLVGVSGVQEAEQVDWIEEVDISATLHQPITALPEGNSYLGFIFARGETPEAVEAALREAHGKLRFEITPEIVLQVM